MPLLLLVFFVTISFCVKAGKVEKGFKSLKIYNYFDAKEKFEKKLKKSTTSPAAFGLATIYFREDNPFHQIDSAYRLILLSENTFNLLKEKKALKYAEYGFSQKAISDLKQNISSYYYDRLSDQNSIAEWTNFIVKNPFAIEILQATRTRDSLALIKARESNTSVSFQQFLKTYPTSELLSEGKEAFHLAQYREETERGLVVSYVTFMKNFPENPYVTQAQDQIYNLMTEINTVTAISTFIKEHPKNRNIDDAWRRLYQVYMYDYSDDRIQQFEKEYPNFPFKKELISDLELSRLILFPIRVFKKFGAMDVNGDLKIPPTYESLNMFYEGLSLASKDGKFGYINKANQVVIPFQYYSGYDFEEGRAIVEVKDKFGLIDRTGKIILPIEFDDIGSFSEGLIYAQKNGKYGYYDKFGQLRIKHIFTEAFSFDHGIAKVQMETKQAYINTLGEYVVSPNQEEVYFFTKNLLLFYNGEYYGLKDLKEMIVLEPLYDQISILSDGLAMVVEDDEIGYIDSLGKMIISPKFEVFANSVEIGQFKDGLAIAKSAGKMGIINRSGKFVLKNTYSQLGKSSEYIAFNKGKLWGFMEESGKVKIAPTYLWAESFENDLAIVATDDKQGVINSLNKEVIGIEYDEITRLENHFFTLEKGGAFGLANEKGTIVVPIEYEEIRQLNATTFVLVKKDQLEYLYLPENRIVQQK